MGRLPRDVYVLQAGLLINALGNGAANPFAVLYLHQVRGIPLALAGLTGSTSAVCAMLAATVAGSLGDRYGVRATMTVGLAISAVGWCLYPLIRAPWHAITLATLTGTGIGTWLTMQSTALALVTPQSLRHKAFAQQRVVANVGLGLGGFLGGTLVTTARPATFTVLFLANGATFLAYPLFLARLRLPGRPPAEVARRGYREIVRDRTFLRLVCLNVAFVTVSVALVNSMFPVFARTVVGVDERAIGALFLLNSLLIVVAQLPVAKLVEGHDRGRGLALMCLFFALTWLLVETAGSRHGALVLLAIAVLCLGFGECLYDSIYGPLVADLAPEGQTGRYMGASGLAWQVSLVVAPVTAGAVLDAEPYALWPLVAALSLAAGGYALRFGTHLPAELRRTPGSRGTVSR